MLASGAVDLADRLALWTGEDLALVADHGEDVWFAEHGVEAGHHVAAVNDYAELIFWCQSLCYAAKRWADAAVAVCTVTTRAAGPVDLGPIAELIVGVVWKGDRLGTAR